MILDPRSLPTRDVYRFLNIKSDHPGVGCFDCHHGVARPGFGPRNQNAPPPPASK